jgi:uncharacterized protein (TIGR02147 family)
MEAALVPIFEYTDYRCFLKACYEERKARDRKFSHRFIADKVGAASTGWFSDLVAGRINLTGAHRARLAKLLELKPNEENYLEAMVNYAHAGSLEERTRCFRKILAFKESKPDLVERDQFEYFAEWYHAAVRELLFIVDFRSDWEDLARRLNPPLRPAQARQSVELLERLRLVRKDERGRYRPTASILKKDSSFRSLHLANFLKANMNLAIESLERHPKEERDISAITVALSEEDFRAAALEVQALRKRLLAMGERPCGGKKVYQCNFQLFPTTR